LKGYGSGSDSGSDYGKVTVPVTVLAQNSDHKENFSTTKIVCTKSCLFDVNRSSFVDKKNTILYCVCENFQDFFITVPEP